MTKSKDLYIVQILTDGNCKDVKMLLKNIPDKRLNFKLTNDMSQNCLHMIVQNRSLTMTEKKEILQIINNKIGSLTFKKFTLQKDSSYKVPSQYLTKDRILNKKKEVIKKVTIHKLKNNKQNSSILYDEKEEELSIQNKNNSIFLNILGPDSIKAFDNIEDIYSKHTRVEKEFHLNGDEIGEVKKQRSDPKRNNMSVVIRIKDTNSSRIEKQVRTVTKKATIAINSLINKYKINRKELAIIVNLNMHGQLAIINTPKTIHKVNLSGSIGLFKYLNSETFINIISEELSKNCNNNKKIATTIFFLNSCFPKRARKIIPKNYFKNIIILYPNVIESITTEYDHMQELLLINSLRINKKSVIPLDELIQSSNRGGFSVTALINGKVQKSIIGKNYIRKFNKSNIDILQIKKDMNESKQLVKYSKVFSFNENVFLKNSAINIINLMKYSIECQSINHKSVDDRYFLALSDIVNMLQKLKKTDSTNYNKIIGELLNGCDESNQGNLKLLISADKLLTNSNYINKSLYNDIYKEIELFVNLNSNKPKFNIGHRSNIFCKNIEFVKNNIVTILDNSDSQVRSQAAASIIIYLRRNRLRVDNDSKDLLTNMLSKCSTESLFQNTESKENNNKKSLFVKASKEPDYTQQRHGQYKKYFKEFTGIEIKTKLDNNKNIKKKLDKVDLDDIAPELILEFDNAFDQFLEKNSPNPKIQSSNIEKVKTTTQTPNTLKD